MLVTLISRIIPQPPSFNKTPAKIIEPETGASTWALGNQRWTKYIGNFTRKANTVIVHKKFGIPWVIIILNFTDPLQFMIITIEISKGNDANKV